MSKITANKNVTSNDNSANYHEGDKWFNTDTGRIWALFSSHWHDAGLATGNEIHDQTNLNYMDQACTQHCISINHNTKSTHTVNQSTRTITIELIRKSDMKNYDIDDLCFKCGKEQNNRRTNWHRFGEIVGELILIILVMHYPVRWIMTWVKAIL